MEANSTEASSPLRLLDRISTRVESLDPPVAAFEKTRDPVTLDASNRLFALADTPGTMGGLSVKQVEEAVFPVGFFRDKARRIVEIGRILAQQGGDVPRDLDGLMALPGVGRKTANLVRSLAFNIPAIAVDIHVFRISRRLGWAEGKDPDRVEEELKKLRDAANNIDKWEVLVGFGQTLCRPRNPLCDECPITRNCPWYASQKKAVGKSTGFC